MFLSRSIFIKWIEDGQIPEDKIQESLDLSEIISGPDPWIRFLDKLLLFTGGIFISFSVIFFIAYNWDLMGRFFKFAIAQAAILSILILHWKLGEKKYTNFFLLIASLLLGGLLALYGQTYQTGADAWQLFFTWSILILPWTVIAKLPALWLFFVTLFNITVIQYYTTAADLGDFLFDSSVELYRILFLFNAAALILWEAAARKFSWMSERWALRIIGSFATSAVTFDLIFTIFSDKNMLLSLFIYAAWTAALYAAYRKFIPDLFFLAGECFSLIISIISFILKLMIDSNSYDHAGALFFLAFVVIGLSALSAFWLKSVHGEQKR